MQAGQSSPPVAGHGAVAPVLMPRRRSNRFMQVAAGCAACVLVVVALAAVGETRRDMALAEAATSFQRDSEAAIKIKAAKEEYDQARGQVHNLKEGLTGLEERLSRQLKVMDAARDDLVKRIKRVEKLPDPADAKSADLQQKVLAKGFISGGTALAAAPLKSLQALRQTSEKTSKVKGIAKKILFPDTADKGDPLTKIEDSVLKKAWGDNSGPSDWKCRVKPKTPGCSKLGKGGSRSSSGGRHKSRKHGSGSSGHQSLESADEVRKREKKIDDDVVRDLKKIVHRHLRSVSAGVEAARTTRDAADAAEHALGYTQHIASQVGELAKQTEKQADRVVAAAKLTAEARDAMRAALQQSSQIVDYNTHAARAVAQDAGFVTTASSAIARYLDGIFADRQTVRKVSTAVVKRLRKDEKDADALVSHIEKDEAIALKDDKYAGKAMKRSGRWSHRSGVAAKTSARAADHALQGEQAALQSGMKALGYARSARDASEYAADYADDAERESRYAASWGSNAGAWGASAGAWDANAGSWGANGFWGPQMAPRSPYEMPFWRNPSATAPSATYTSGPQAYSPYYPYTPFGTAPYGYGLQGSAASPLKRAKELVDSVVVLMQHLTRSLESAGPNCQLVNGYLVAYQRGMASYRAQGVGLGNLLSDEDMKLVEQYAEVQVQSFASDLEDAMANAESYCGLAGGVSLANGAPTVALGQVSTTHRAPYMSVPGPGVFQGAGGQFMGGDAPRMQQMALPESNGPAANPFMSSPYAGLSQLQQPSMGARITPVAGMSTPQFMGASPMQMQRQQSIFKETGQPSSEQL